MGKYTLNAERAQRILELCVKHSQHLPRDIREEVDAMLDDETRKYETKIKDIPYLSTRTRNVLWCANCDTVADVLAYGKNRFLMQRACGKTTIAEIEKVLGELGFTLPEIGEERNANKKKKRTTREHETREGFLLRCAADAMYAMIRRVEGEKRNKCSELLDGRCSSKCKRFDICVWRQLRSVADQYEAVRKDIK